MCNHALDVVEVGVRSGCGTCQNELGVEDVQPLVLHGTHVEVTGGDDHETLEVQWQIEARLIPRNAGHEGVHCVFSLIQVTRTHVDL